MYTPKMVIERVTLLRMHGGCIIIKSYDSMSVNTFVQTTTTCARLFQTCETRYRWFHSSVARSIWRGIDCKTWMVRVVKLYTPTDDNWIMKFNSQDKLRSRNPPSPFPTFFLSFGNLRDSHLRKDYYHESNIAIFTTERNHQSKCKKKIRSLSTTPNISKYPRDSENISRTKRAAVESSPKGSLMKI